ncbi:MAG: cell division protein FtsL [Thermoleophilia bacterium]|nr:cell division protein FtsL [Thermoleophilia bacterium]MDH4344977.1 cell division protein FtsL [Thermoleophilia bacterium]MDH5333245.1 cell division protein FtsL [Thermoleophilia bacterium]
MSTIADAPLRRRARARGGAKARRSRFPEGVVWIVVVAALLAGVVAVNVAVLQLNVELDRLGVERAQLRADNARLRARLSSASASIRIETQARARLGVESADPLLTTYVDLAPER